MGETEKLSDEVFELHMNTRVIVDRAKYNPDSFNITYLCESNN